MTTKQKRLHKGLCTNCGKTPCNGKYTTCFPCRKSTAEYLQSKRLERIALGLCRYCGNNSVQSHSTVCVLCEQKYRISPKHRRAKYVEAKLKVLNGYGGTICACCKQEFDPIFLCMDHINNDGYKTRKNQTGYHGIYGWLIKNDFPEGFQVLCHNCNWAKHANGGICPHQDPDYKPYPTEAGARNAPKEGD